MYLCRIPKSSRLRLKYKIKMLQEKVVLMAAVNIRL